MRDIRLHLVGFILMFLYSCTSDDKETTQNNIPVTMKGPSVSKAHPGKMIYMQFCMACHMEKGEGVPRLYPPLIQTELVLGDKERLIKIILYGQEGLIEVNGEQYNNVMAKLDYLRDNEISDVLSYVRSSFKNNAEAIAGSEVKKVRSDIAK